MYFKDGFYYFPEAADNEVESDFLCGPSDIDWWGRQTFPNGVSREELLSKIPEEFFDFWGSLDTLLPKKVEILLLEMSPEQIFRFCSAAYIEGAVRDRIHFMNSIGLTEEEVRQQGQKLLSEAMASKIVSRSNKLESFYYLLQQHHNRYLETQDAPPVQWVMENARYMANGIAGEEARVNTLERALAQLAPDEQRDYRFTRRCEEEHRIKMKNLGYKAVLSVCAQYDE